MRIVVTEFESDNASADHYDFLGCKLKIINTEPFFLRHEYFEKEKQLKQSLYLFGRRTNERGAQVFIHWYMDYRNNLKYSEDLAFYERQKQNFRISVAKDHVIFTLLPEINGGVNWDQLMTKDGKYRRRIVYNIRGKHNGLLLVFSLDSNEFPQNLLFNFVKEKFKIELE